MAGVQAPGTLTARSTPPAAPGFLTLRTNTRRTTPSSDTCASDGPAINRRFL
ncbi:Hypothetical predicted protein [Lynx pardinus]|uniref:Uncharacterized protein n=1 Tax=Lynx pardinus TaxID=191816 RepID=A0A485P726_LYNPA|nr:Hypothetical predicted protein [Lynx pardinus]